MEARIPFAGFYESLWSDAVDREHEQTAEYLAEEHDLPETQVWEAIYNNSNYNNIYRDVAERYAERFGDMLEVQLSYTEMTSPKEYNFETDRIFVNISIEDAYKLYRKVGKKKVRAMARKMFTSRDGFISFYDPDIDSWGHLSSWDHNQLYCMLTALVEDSEYELSLYEDMLETITMASQAHVDWDKVNFKLGELVGKKPEEEEPKLYPKKWRDTEDYVQQYYSLNQGR